MVALVLLPGMDGTGTLFQPLIAEIGDCFNVKVIRYPSTEAFGYETLEEFVVKTLPVDEPFVILGESFSGPIAISIAAAQPKGLIGVILCCTFAINPRPTFSVFRSLLKILPPRLAPIAVLDYLLLGRYSTRELRSALALAVGQVSSAAFEARLNAIHAVNFLSKLKFISVPVLYLQATKDRVVPPTAAYFIQKELSTVRIVPIDAPHCLLQAVPSHAASIIKLFSAEVQ
ncbi:alpha/beta fold hydrolase [Acinetobacter gyllenbergii]|uniref:alpha/beta fold hydrolase n=1 Tax=Acinetobacter gyllenbergii TaxID=134534 RepID=UPI003F57E20F